MDDFISVKSMVLLAISWILAFVYALVAKIVPNGGSAAFFGPIFEYIIAFTLILSLIIAVIADISNLTPCVNTLIVILVSIAAKLVISIVVEVSFWVLLSILLFAIVVIGFETSIGGVFTLLFEIIAESLGILGPILAILFVICSVFGSALVW